MNNFVEIKIKAKFNQKDNNIKNINLKCTKQHQIQENSIKYLIRKQKK